MTEIGGYIELEYYHGEMLHGDGILLNCGRKCLAYLIEARDIRGIWIPYLMCDSVEEPCKEYGVKVHRYHVGADFLPRGELKLGDGDYLYLMDYYGQLSEAQTRSYKEKYPRLILDRSHAYFKAPIPGIDTIYTCRKYLGVADGAILYTDQKLARELPRDESWDRMGFLMGRLERTASEFYADNVVNNERFTHEPIKTMSRLTENFLHSVDYEFISARRTDNFAYLHSELSGINKLDLTIPVGAFMYPLYIDGGMGIRKMLQAKKIYIPTLWPDVLKRCDPESEEYLMAENILPLPVDQRYDRGDMEYLVNEVRTAYEN